MRKEVDNKNLFAKMEVLLNAKATSATVERMFSTYGLVQSNIRNKLGLMKAANLVFLFNALNNKKKIANSFNY